ncbi:cysteine-rich motor neuron 1 protein-like [Mizuhopecten yessoensis]|uniref:cysteine-rich motor neuron 1 protein-like n=1 Tax=Mizuhopecten yessoensis TaxID=6573 RepID=UPI000B4577F4|nr:cysteine-rich motor neuron 1 protein-like [Mizuhopecten yessoensis]
MDKCGFRVILVGAVLFICTDYAEGVCRRNGVFYETGESVPASRCRPCSCNNGGRIFCRRLSCPRLNCIGARVIPGHCCPTCPTLNYRTYRKWTYNPQKYDRRGSLDVRELNDSGSDERGRGGRRRPVFRSAHTHHQRTATSRHLVPVVQRMRPSSFRNRIFDYLYIRKKSIDR